MNTVGNDTSLTVNFDTHIVIFFRT